MSAPAVIEDGDAGEVAFRAIEVMKNRLDEKLKQKPGATGFE